MEWKWPVDSAVPSTQTFLQPCELWEFSDQCLPFEVLCPSNQRCINWHDICVITSTILWWLKSQSLQKPWLCSFLSIISIIFFLFNLHSLCFSLLLSAILGSNLAVYQIFTMFYGINGVSLNCNALEWTKHVCGCFYPLFSNQDAGQRFLSESQKSRCSQNIYSSQI